MQLNIENQDELLIVTINETELDADSAEAFKTELEPHIQEQVKMIMDMSSLTFVDSSGLGTILAVKRLVDARQGQLVLCCMTTPVKEIMDLVRLSRVFRIEKTLDEAKATLT